MRRGERLGEAHWRVRPDRQESVIVKTIKYVTVRRWCRDCKKQVSAKPPGTAPHARYGANVGAVLNFLNMSGLSHARSAEFAGDALGTPVSCSSAYRNKISRALQMAPERDAVRKKILKEPHLGADEFHWPLKGRRGYGVVALGKESCLVEIVDSRKTKTIKGVLPGYEGIITQDSYPAWLQSGRPARCAWFTRSAWCIWSGTHVAEFLAGLSAVHKKIYRAWRIKDPHSRAVSADCIRGGAVCYRQARHHRQIPQAALPRGVLHDDLPADPGHQSGQQRGGESQPKVRLSEERRGQPARKGMDANSVLFTMWPLTASVEKASSTTWCVHETTRACVTIYPARSALSEGCAQRKKANYLQFF